MTPEFSRTWPAGEIGDRPREVSIEADEAERAALAKRFAIVAIDRLSAAARLQRRADGIYAEGRVSAQVVQSCVVTGEPVPAAIDEAFVLRFVENFDPDAEELELSEADCDTVPIENGAIDLGEAVAETLALALDPWPRSAHADQALDEAGVSDGSDVGPFAALRELKEKLKK
ncbi:YceD family protein [Sphingomonas sanxanigenens]|uniref:DUF177 domain-containing protein n=1 Tax=Sphingomonas sanxanigenens DSM 19645 = NX02 TaxID=1123269 RepID=W0ALJ8_9SPHN|nr:DUF177 domain-containing protein [Sphingomonas sanxanigenens]AHE57188.1 hypothetical protein NX02_28025 [Sphingomonas sanxanigenens DSM 19645 = NX02]